MSFQYLKTFFSEKSLDQRVYEVSGRRGTPNFICTEDVVDALLNASPATQSKAADILRVIDATNADPHNFLEHMAGGLAIDLEDL